MRWEQPLATIILGIGGILLAIAGIVQHVSTLLNDAGDVIIPFTFVMFGGLDLRATATHCVQVFFEQPQGRAGRIVPSAIAAVLVGFIIATGETTSCLASSTTHCPCRYGGVVAAVLYAAAARIWPRTLAAAGPSQPVVLQRSPVVHSTDPQCRARNSHTISGLVFSLPVRLLSSTR